MPKQFLKLLLLVFLVTKLIACQQHVDEHSEVLARIGEKTITADEFLYNYEFGHGHLRQGDDPKRTYLDFMIAEKLLALEASKIDLDTSSAIQHALHTLREELLIEQVFNDRVLSNIEVSDQEIRDEINKAAVSFQFRFMPAASEREALNLLASIQTNGFAETLESHIESNPELSLARGELTSSFVKADEIDPSLLAIITDLPLNNPSEPALYQGAWYIFEVLDIRRERLSEYDYEQKAPSYRKVLYNKKAMELGTAFIAETMQPLNVRTKRKGFEILNDALWAWYEDDQPERNLLFYIEQEKRNAPYIDLLTSNAAEPLVDVAGSTWTIRTFLEHFTPGRYVMRARDRDQFKVRLADVVALVVRDATLLEIANGDNLSNSEEYQQNITQWMDKWLFQEYKAHLQQARQIDAAYLTQRLNQYVDSLDGKYKIWINEAMLDTLTPSSSELNPKMTVHLFKSNSNKMPFPIADPNWVKISDAN